MAAAPGQANVAMDSDYAAKVARIQEEPLRKAFGVVRAQLAEMQPPSEQAWTLVDLGCADGLISVPFFRAAVDEIRKRDTDRSILIVFEDQTCNDFSKAMKIEAKEFGPKVFVNFSSTTFFQQVMPPGSVHLSFSSYAMHYLGGPPPCNLNSGLKETDAAGAEKEAFAAMAAVNWEQLLLARAEELAVGGRTVILNLCVDESTGFYCGSVGRGCSLYTEIGACLREMVEAGRMTQLEFEWATSPEYYRTVAEHRAPFDDPNSPVRRAGLVLKSVEVQRSECPHALGWIDGKYESAEAFAKEFAWLCTAFSYHKCMRAFQHPGNERPEPEQRALVDEVYQRFEARVARSPASFGVDAVNLCLVIEKVALPVQ